MTLMLVGTDFAKRVSALHGVDESGTPLGPALPGAGPHGLPYDTRLMACGTLSGLVSKGMTQYLRLHAMRTK